MQIIQSKKFTDNTISVYAPLRFERSTITATNIMIYMMKNKTEAYDTKQKFVSALNLAYGMKLYFGLTSYGDDLVLSMRVQYIRSDYVEEEDYISKVIHLMDQALFHSCFDMKNFEEAKYLLKTKLTRMLDDPDSLSVYESFLNVDSSHKVSIPVQGFLSDLDSISLDDVQFVYRQYLESKKHVFVCGDVDSKMYQFLSSIDSNCPIHINHTLLKNVDYKEKIIKKDISQSSICLMYETNTDIFSNDYYSLYLMNCVLGQSPSSLLFNEVREKNSYCYSVQSSLIRFDGVLMIYCGTSKENVDQAIDLIEEQIQKLVDMSYDEELLDIAKKDCVDALYVAKDQPFSLISQRFLDSVLNRTLTMEEKINCLEQISQEDICNVAKKLRKISCVVVEEE